MEPFMEPSGADPRVATTVASATLESPRSRQRLMSERISRMAPRRAALVPDLPRNAWIVLSGELLSAIGTGLSLPFFIVYLHRVRGIDLGLAGIIVAGGPFAS